ncbi:PNPOx family protein [Flavisolibacter ginsengisoli]|jgi:uncharacterized protein YhbP (UPF0306 family)|uniref:Uncharacterized protein n=1 Tax=Flavisolibacter ginsengisoli DSM 18119 TaxID=1121884 RepID=A0A1M4YC63_9BACT|nr:pyridoxamine 5'-phosphate oxidase family protein [Flavisolibacter ginsengisoli]SHF03259.1 hypothetical protein SAMN02745131_01670 [Flavisolibacter ginsengisoli DSM 18119]
MDPVIIRFMQRQTVASFTCIDEEGLPYCFTCFYAFDAENDCIYFKSSSSSKHAGLLQKNGNLAGSVLPDKLNVLAIQGIQFTGHIATMSHGSSFYHKKFPMAVAMPGEVWTVCLDTIKMTNNKAGFGKKLTWNREEPLTLKKTFLPSIY